MVDPDLRMAGKGIKTLERAGIEVIVGLEGESCQQLNDAYVLARVEHRPRFTLKVACSLDGYICSAFGNSQWITNDDSRLASRRLRDTHDGILVGIGTIIADNPSLNSRIPGGFDPVPIILDSACRTPNDAKVISAGKRPLLFHSTTDTDIDDLECISVSHDGDGLNLEEIANYLVQKEIYSVLLEGGAKIYQSFVNKNWIDRIELFIAPKLLGDGIKWLSSSPFALSTAPYFELYETIQYKSDIRLRYRKR